MTAATSRSLLVNRRERIRERTQYRCSPLSAHMSVRLEICTALHNQDWTTAMLATLRGHGDHHE